MFSKNKFQLAFIAIFIGLGLLFFYFAKISDAQTAATGADSADAIAVRVVPNPNHYSIARWYESQGFAGSPQALIVDGYEAIRDGRTVYVNATNVDLNSNPPTVYTNIYLISYNQNPEAKTVDILGQIVSHWKFNGNLEDSAASCSISSLSCATDTDCGQNQFCATTSAGVVSSSCQLKVVKNCLVDTDCPLNFFCDSVKAKISRDVKRIGKLEELKESLFRFKTVNNRYPLLSAGTYLSNLGVSVWPSWSQSFLSELAANQNFFDPINRLGACPGYDTQTCWNETAKRFVNDPINNSLILPAGSYAMVYSTDKIGSDYHLCATLETRHPSLNYQFSPNPPADSNCVTAGIISGGQIGNTPPRLVDYFLTGEVEQEFNGFVKVTDAENNPLTYLLETGNNDWSTWSAAPVLLDTSAPNQKKIYAAKAGYPGIYNVTLGVIDGQGGSLATTVPINITSPAPYLDFSCLTAARVGQNYECRLGPVTQANHTLTFRALDLPAGITIPTPSGTPAYYNLFGAPTATSTGQEITITATNERGVASAKKFTLRINNYCGDGQQQLPNMEGGGGRSGGYEDCDGSANIATTVVGSSVNKQYGCTNNCVFKPAQFDAPADLGGYCGDGYCQCVQDPTSGECTWENCQDCYQDCGNCSATIESFASQEQIAYLNGQRIYKTNKLNELGKSKLPVATGDNALGFWVHNSSNDYAIGGYSSNDYGLAYRMLIGPANAPYDVIDTTNSALRCAVAGGAGQDIDLTRLSDASYDPANELVNQGKKWTETGFAETGASKAFTNSVVLDKLSPLTQINVVGSSASGTYLPFIWGTKTVAPTTSAAYYCRLTYNYDTSNFGVCRPRCQDQECGSDSCGGTCGSCAARYPQYDAAQLSCSPTNQCVCTPNCSGRPSCSDDGCGGKCPSSCPPGKSCVQMSVDDFHDTYFNGALITNNHSNCSYGSGGSTFAGCRDQNDNCIACWRNIQAFEVNTNLGKNVFAIKADNETDPYGIAAQFIQSCDDTRNTNDVNGWKCTSVTPNANWKAIDYIEDGNWQEAKNLGKKASGNALCPDIGQIWASGTYAKTVYCRYDLYLCNNNGVCDTGEDYAHCPNDNCASGTGTPPPGTGTSCNNNGICDAGETITDCPNDNCSSGTGTPPPGTGTLCGNNLCGVNENKTNCPIDCFCGDTTCLASDGEDKNTCPLDCGHICGDGICADPFETVDNCREDCGWCGDGHCADNYCNDVAVGCQIENCTCCPDDCGPCGACSVSGDCTNYAEDCVNGTCLDDRESQGFYCLDDTWYYNVLKY